MELLIIKSGNDYIRVKDDHYLICGLDKASVFPMDQTETVKNHILQLKSKQFKSISVKKLIMTEEDIDL